MHRMPILFLPLGGLNKSGRANLGIEVPSSFTENIQHSLKWVEMSGFTS